MMSPAMSENDGVKDEPRITERPTNYLAPSKEQMEVLFAEEEGTRPF